MKSPRKPKNANKFPTSVEKPTRESGMDKRQSIRALAFFGIFLGIKLEFKMAKESPTAVVSIAAIIIKK